MPGGPGPTNHHRMDPERLRSLRVAMFLSQSEFLRKYGLDIRDYESGKPRKHGCRGSTVRAFAEVFGVEPQDLVVS